MSSVLQIMRLFAPDKLVEVFAESYIYFHGEKKVKEICVPDIVNCMKRLNSPEQIPL